MEINEFKQNTNKIVNSIDVDALKVLQEKLKKDYFHDSWTKFFDIENEVSFFYNLYLNVFEENELDQTIFDLGCGCGVFPYICKFFNHNVYTSEIPVEPSIKANNQHMIKTLEMFYQYKEILKINTDIILNIGKNNVFDLKKTFDTIFLNRISYCASHDFSSWCFLINNLKSSLTNKNKNSFISLNINGTEPGFSSFRDNYKKLIQNNVDVKKITEYTYNIIINN